MRMNESEHMTVKVTEKSAVKYKFCNITHTSNFKYVVKLKQ